MILAGDVGGTKCNLALYDCRDGRLAQVISRRYGSKDFPTFGKVIEKFLEDISQSAGEARNRKIDAAGFGVAGPVIDYSVKATNLPWVVDGRLLEKQLGTERIVLLNDLEATGYSLDRLDPGDVLILNRGVAVPKATQALIAAGTGLGEAILFWDGGRYVVAGSEGGHADLAPRSEQEIELLRYLKKRHEFVSAELILSGRGFRTIHEFLDPTLRHPSFDIPNADAAPEITRLGLGGECAVCVDTLQLWTAIYGAEAGNLALKVLARGGVWVAGGIAAKLRKKMEDGTFVREFCRKEKFAAMMSEIPIRMILNEEAPLLGAACQAAGVLS